MQYVVGIWRDSRFRMRRMQPRVRDAERCRIQSKNALHDVREFHRKVDCPFVGPEGPEHRQCLPPYAGGKSTYV